MEGNFLLAQGFYMSGVLTEADKSQIQTIIYSANQMEKWVKKAYA